MYVRSENKSGVAFLFCICSKDLEPQASAHGLASRAHAAARRPAARGQESVEAVRA